MTEPAVVIDAFRGFFAEPLLRCLRLSDAQEIEVTGEPDADLPRTGTIIRIENGKLVDAEAGQLQPLAKGGCGKGMLMPAIRAALGEDVGAA